MQFPHAGNYTVGKGSMAYDIELMKRSEFTETMKTPILSILEPTKMASILYTLREVMLLLMKIPMMNSSACAMAYSAINAVGTLPLSDVIPAENCPFPLLDRTPAELRRRMTGLFVEHP
jgi:hypothetical protein